MAGARRAWENSVGQLQAAELVRAAPLSLVFCLVCGHAAQDLPSCGRPEPGVSDAADHRFAASALVCPDGSQPVVGHDDVAFREASRGLKGIGFQPHAFCGVLLEPVGDVVLSLRCGADVRPANEIRMPQRSIADQIGRLHVFPVGVFELPDGCFVGRLLGKGNAGAKRQ